MGKELDLLIICSFCSDFRGRASSNRENKNNLSWFLSSAYHSTSHKPVLWDCDEPLMLAVWKMGEIDRQNRCIDTCSCLLSSLGFCSHGGGIEKEPANYFHLMSLKPKGKDTLPGS